MAIIGVSCIAYVQALLKYPTKRPSGNTLLTQGLLSTRKLHVRFFGCGTKGSIPTPGDRFRDMQGVVLSLLLSRLGKKANLLAVAVFEQKKGKKSNLDKTGTRDQGKLIWTQFSFQRLWRGQNQCQAVMPV